MSSSYPKGWPKLSFDVKKKAGFRCEWCRETGQKGPKSRGMVTAHLDQIHSNCERSNLACLCRRCHNRYDSWGISPLLPKTEISRRISFLNTLTLQEVDLLKGLSGKYPEKGRSSAKAFRWSQRVAAVRDTLQQLLTIRGHYKALKNFRPVVRKGVPANWTGYMKLFG